MVEHRLLTGDSLHEPKGVELATAGQVYQANGSGSGVWVDRLSGIVDLNRFVLSGTIPNVSTPGSSFFVSVPFKSQLNRLQAVLGGTLTTANDTITVYKNGVAQTPTVTIPFTGSGAGVATNQDFSSISFNANDVIEVRTNGASDGDFPLSVVLSLTSTA